MQIKTAYNLKFFNDSMQKKFGLTDYNSVKDPTFFYGLYSEDDFKAIANHKGKRLLFWGGSDSMNYDMVQRVKKLEVIHVAQSTFVAEDLRRNDISCEIIHILNTDTSLFKPCPLGDKIYWYKAGRGFYGKRTFYRINNLFPDLKFKVFNRPTIPHEEMPKVYEECFLGVRPVEHDGCSQTVGEMGLMGRKCIYNGDIPNAVNYDSDEDIIDRIIELQAGYDYKKVAGETRLFYEDSDNRMRKLIKLIHK